MVCRGWRESFTSLALLILGIYCVAHATLSPSETLRPGTAGLSITALLIALLVPASAQPRRAAQVLRVGAPALVFVVAALTGIVFLFDRAAFDRTSISVWVLVCVFIALPTYITASFLRAATRAGGGTVGDRSGDPDAGTKGPYDGQA